MAPFRFTTLLALALFAFPATLRAQAERMDSLPADSVLLEVRVGRLVSATMQGRRLGDVAFLPLVEVCLLVKVRCVLDPGIYASLDSIATRLHTSVAIDWDQLTVTIAPARSLPVVREFERSRRRSALHRVPGDNDVMDDDPITSTDVHNVSTARLGYYAVSPSFDLRKATLAVSLNATTANGAIEADGTVSAFRSVNNRVSVLRTWDRSHHIRQMRVGDILSAQPYFRHLRGISITNAPDNDAMHADSVVVSGRTGPHRELEVYRDGSLIAADSADGHGNYIIPVPVGYGTNVLTVISYGPFGDERRYVRRVVIPQGMLPEHRLVYSISAGRCVQDDCHDALSSGLEFAPTSRITSGVGLYVARAHKSLTLTPATWLTAQIADAVTLYATVVGSTNALATIQLAPAVDVDLTATYRASSVVPSPSPVSIPLARREFSATTSWRTSIFGQRTTVLGELATLHTSLSSTSRARLRTFVPTPAGYVDAFVRRTSVGIVSGLHNAVTSVGADAFLLIGGHLPLLHGAVARFSYERATERAADHAELALATPVIGAIALDVQARWQGGRPHPQLLIAMRTTLDDVRVRSAVDISEAGQRSALHSIQGSLEHTRS